MRRDAVRRRLTAALAPLLLTVYPILYLYSTNIEQLGLDDGIQTLFICLGLTLLVLLFLSVIFRHVNKGAVITSLIIILFYSYGHLHDLLKPSSHRYLLIPYALVLVIGIVLIAAKGKHLQIPLTYLTLFAAVLVVLPLLQIVAYLVNTANHAPVEIDTQDLEFLPVIPDPLPDIYYIILDGYTRADILQDYYGYDNSPFIEALEDRGFYVAPESRSNYVLSFLSLASSLNMEFLTTTNDSAAPSTERSVPYQLIQDGAVWDFLDQAGYRLLQFSSGWGPTDYNPFADVNYVPSYFNEFQANLIKTTLLQPFYLDWAVEQSRHRILAHFDELARVPTISEPTFAFAHLLLPHPPYVFGPDGQKAEYEYLLGGGLIWSQTDGYRDQVIFANEKVLALVDRILADSSTPPIIIFQGDHGTASTDGWAGPDPLLVRERTAILNAYYFPDDGAAHLYPTISPINSFRVLFNTYFGQQFDLLEDRVYFSTYEQPYRLSDVTH
jgi:hypothetical protein